VFGGGRGIGEREWGCNWDVPRWWYRRGLCTTSRRSDRGRQGLGSADGLAGLAGGWRRGEIERVDVWTSVDITESVCVIHLGEVSVVVAVQGGHVGGLGELRERGENKKRAAEECVVDIHIWTFGRTYVCMYVRNVLC
jgi:hypothetical protein